MLGTSRIAHSQPGSRSTSPTPKYSYLTHTNNGVHQLTPLMNTSNYNNNNNINNSNGNHINNSNISNDLASTPNSYSTNGGLSKLNGMSSAGRHNTSSSATKSKIPTSSRNSSRESSPGRRSNYGSERRTSITKNATRRGLYGRQLTNGSDSEQVLANAMSNKYVSAKEILKSKPKTIFSVNFFWILRKILYKRFCFSRKIIFI